MAGDGEGDDASDASDDQAAEAAAQAAEAASAIGGEVSSGGEGFGGPGFGGATDIGGEQEATPGAFGRAAEQAEEQAETTRGKVSLQTTLSEKKAVAFSAKQQEQKGFFEDLTEDFSWSELFGFPDQSKFATTPGLTEGHYSTSFGLAPPSPTKGAGVAPTDESIEASLASVGVNVTSPADEPGGVDYIPPKVPRTRAIAARNNSVGLAIAEKEDGFPTRERLRRARRVTRFV